MSELIWPDKTTHGCDSQWSRGEHAGEWRDERRHGPNERTLRQLWDELEKTSLPGVKLTGEYERITGGPGLPGRHCWYCGSIHPGDLYELLASGNVLKLGGADWKYGWPHKFYVEVTNLRSDVPYVSSSRSGGPCAVCLDEIYSCHPYTSGGPALPPRNEWPAPKADCEWCEGSGHNPSHLPKGTKPYGYPTLTGKFYNVHLEELEADAFEALTGELTKRTGIEFFRNDDGKLMYRAPYRGFQA